MDNQHPSVEVIWKSVQECPRYEVNQYGEIRHIYRKQILKPRYNKGGYGYVSFKIDGRNKNFAVHRIVANAFIPNLQNKLEVNHKDGDTTNNKAENLEWVSSSENKIHAYQKKENHNSRGKIVKQFSMDGALIAIYPTITEAHKNTKISLSGISACCNGTQKTSGGFIWKFDEGSKTKYERKPVSSVRSIPEKDEDIV